MSRIAARSLLAALLVAAAVSPHFAGAAGPAGGGKGGGGGGTHAIRVVGTIAAINSSSRTVTLTTGTYYNTSAVFNIAAATKVTLNGKPAQYGDLKVGDAADASFDDRSVVANTFGATR